MHVENRGSGPTSDPVNTTGKPGVHMRQWMQERSDELRFILTIIHMHLSFYLL